MSHQDLPNGGSFGYVVTLTHFSLFLIFLPIIEDSNVFARYFLEGVSVRQEKSTYLESMRRKMTVKRNAELMRMSLEKPLNFIWSPWPLKEKARYIDWLKDQPEIPGFCSHVLYFRPAGKPDTQTKIR